MADVVDFPHRVPGPARTVEQLRARKMSTHPSCDITIRKDDRERRYVILSDAPGYFQGDIWYGRDRHFHKRTAGVHDARMMAQRFRRELEDLVTDGWTI